ncbi:MAG: nicotinamide mononucleotide transporter [Clostridia bacterium]|nr:nicotinamide mononucleotide transporter [Clostridia bacterium]
MKIHNPFRHLTKFEWSLWGVSLAVVTVSFFVGGSGGLLSLCASLLGVTALIFVAKGDVTGQFLSVLFAVLYAIVSWEQRYYGEMITYLCMSAPAAVFSIVSWLRHPYGKDHSEVRIARMTVGKTFLLFGATALVTLVFYWILKWLGNAELIVSTLSVTTSFLAASLLFLRSPYYALAYTANDVVLIVLWVVASFQDLSYLSMVACFLMFLFNDLYGFFNWLRMRKKQNKEEQVCTAP